MCPQWSEVVGADLHSHKIATTTTSNQEVSMETLKPSKSTTKFVTI